MFGLKYIRTDVHAIHTGRCAIEETQAFKTAYFSGNMIVETNEVPINILYTQGHEIMFEYYDNYDGFTSSKIDNPSITIERDASGNCVIKTYEYKRFIYESSSSKRYLNIYIPLSFVSGDVAYTQNLSIKTNTAPIYFDVEGNPDNRVPAHNKLTIETQNGPVKYRKNIRAISLNYKTDNTIKMYCDQDKEVFATDYELESRLGRIAFYDNVVGNLKLKTKNGDISLVSCKNLVAETTFGDVFCSRKEEDKQIQIRGIVKITTKSGSVELGDVDGNGENKIQTGGGRVVINKIKDGKITTKRGSVTIKSVRNVSIETNVGKVSIEEALEKINVNTKRGNVVLGGEGMVVNNPTIASRIGKVTVVSASGKVDIQTINSNVKFINKDSSDIFISAGKALNAEKLTGNVELYANGKTYLEFSKITNRTSITLGDSCYFAEIHAENNTDSDTKFLFEGKAVTRYEDQGKVKLESDKNPTTDAYITVTGKNAEIHAYFKKA